MVFGKLNAFEKANSAKLVMQVSEKEGEPEPVWNLSQCGTRQCHFLSTRILRTACEVGLSLIFFGHEPAHVPFGTEHKHIINKCRANFAINTASGHGLNPMASHL